MSQNDPQEVEIRFTVNGKEVFAKAPSNMKLLDFLRKQLGLLGAKDGCSNGDCGACTVIINGKAVRSCLMQMSRMNGKTVETIENLSKNGNLHPIQYAFIKERAVQCGFCTPGMIMSTKALLDANPTPSEEEIRSALKLNLCRCTGYATILRAIHLASELMREGVKFVDPNTIELGPKTGSLIGVSVLDKDVIKKVTGQLRFGDDREKEGMLFGKVLWAKYPSAEILGIDISEAEVMKGVKLILTAKNIPGVNKLGIIVSDQPAMADKRVRCISDPVAAIFAISEEIAEAALEKIKVDYKVLPGVFTVEDAAKPDSPAVHEPGNICHKNFIKRGDTKKAFKEADIVVEGDYSTPVIDQGFLEPESGLAWPTENGGVEIEIGTQATFDDRTQLSKALAIPEEKIRVRQLPLGGAFGGKEDIILQFILALGAIRSGHPVKIVLTRQESFRTHPKRHGSKIHFKTAANKDGKLIAVEANFVIDTGAYASLGPDVLENMLSFGAGPYYIPNLDLNATAYYTNNIPCGAMRGFGVPQAAFGMEQQIDKMARAIGMDPFEFRLINALEVGSLLATDHVLESSVGIKQTLLETKKVLESLSLPKLLNGRKIGIGIASGMKNVGFGHGLTEDAGAYVELTENGTFLINGGTHEYGQGTLTAMMQIVASELGIRYDQVNIGFTDTATSPATGPTTASRQTFLSGNAMVMASRKLKEKILEFAEEELMLPASDLDIRDGKLVHIPSGKTFDFENLNTRISAQARYRAPETMPFSKNPSSFGKDGFVSRRTHWAYSFATHVAVVEVNEINGEVKVLNFIAAQDAGRAINPQIVNGQIEGGVLQGIGFALTEEFKIKDGYNLTDTLRKYHLPNIKDLPDIIPIIVEDPVPNGPFGAKGVGEAAMLPAAAAIANAIHDAIGVRVTSLPATKNKILDALNHSGE